jgi:primary-amine oxidase
MLTTGQFDYTFQLDGSIEIRLSASGYLQGAVWTENSAEYGHAIHRDNMGSLHDHVINCEYDPVAGAARRCDESG